MKRIIKSTLPAKLAGVVGGFTGVEELLGGSLKIVQWKN
jgi:hypothetical protein